MTNLEALRAFILYPLKDNSFKLALLNRGLLDSDEYSVSNRQSLELAGADSLRTILTTPSIAEGDYKISLSEKSEIRKLATSIYKKWGEPDPFATQIEDITDRW